MHPINLLAKLTTKSKQIDGMGFGGIAPDNLEVAGAMGLRNPRTGKRLSRPAELLVRCVYCDDDMCFPELRALLIDELQKIESKVKFNTISGLAKAAINNYRYPIFKTDRYGFTVADKDGQPLLIHKTDAEIARQIGIRKQSYSEQHKNLYGNAIITLGDWSREAFQHLILTMRDNEELLVA